MIENTNLKNDMAHAFSRRNMIMPPATVEDAADAEGKHVGPASTVSNVECKSFKGVVIDYDIDDCVGSNNTTFTGITAGTEYVDDYGVTWWDVADRTPVISSASNYLSVLVWDTENFAITEAAVPLKHAVKQSTYIQLTGSVYDPKTDNLQIKSYMLFEKKEADPFNLYVFTSYRFQIFGNTSKGYIKVLKVNPKDHSEIIDEVASVQILDGAQSRNMISYYGAAIEIPVTAGAGCYLVTFVTENASSSSFYIGGIIVEPQEAKATVEVTLSSGRKSDHEVEIQ